MTRKITPFRNGTEAMMWLERNCEVCRTKSRCSEHHNIETGFITGEISLNAAHSIGYEDDELYTTCRMKDNRELPKRKKKTDPMQTLII